MPEKPIDWTDQQARAIKARGSDVLVTASAGTGKTSVLSGRCVDLLAESSGDVLGMLVLTFTNAAAEQMRARIAEQLSSAYEATGDKNLRGQLLLLGGADISTIHSFCKKIITEHFFKLGIDPTFRVIEADEAILLKAEALDATIEWAWAQPHLAEGLSRLLKGRAVTASDVFLSTVISLSDYLDGQTSRDHWYERAETIASALNPLTAELGRKQKELVSEKLAQILCQIRFAQKLYDEHAAEGNWAQQWEDEFVSVVQQCRKFLAAGNWAACADRLRSFKKPTKLKYKAKGLAGPVAEVVKDAAEGAKKAFDSLRALAVINPDYLDRVAPVTSLQTKTLIELVKRFEQVYGESKRKINCLDFADLEHYALRLLAAPAGADSQIVPSETALALRQRYKYIFVDEYQDINPVQKAMLDALRDKDNIFVVGDVKQSIYAFRGAEPKIFANELRSVSAESEKKTGGIRIDLNTNWRSQKGILDFVNEIFGRIMRSSVADIDYDDSAELRPGLDQQLKTGAAVAEKDKAVELHILDEQPADNANENSSSGETADILKTVSSRQRQAALIARRIRQMVGADTGEAEFQVYDKDTGAFRDVRYGDIAILMRSPANRAAEYVQMLQLANVPVSSDAASGFFEATEITDMLCLLKVLDNPRRDIELAAVLRSPLFGLTDTELARIKLFARDRQCAGFYDCLPAYGTAEPDEKLSGKLITILDTLTAWREMGRRDSIADLIWQVYAQSGYLSFVCALPNGQSRRANLLKLHERAIQFERFASSSWGTSLARFVEFIEKLQAAGQEWSGPACQGLGEDAVRLISVHKSKGLEFGVVFLAEVQSPFSSKDFQSDCLIDSDGVLGLRIIDAASHTKLDSIGYQVIAEQKRKLFLAEEMRILYVAMTRARDRLVLAGAGKSDTCRKFLAGAFYSTGPAADWQINQAHSFLDWILTGLGDSRQLHRVFETGLREDCVADELFDLRVYGQVQLEQLSQYVQALKRPKPAATDAGRKTQAGHKLAQLPAKVRKLLSWRYDFEAFSALPAKMSVSELTHASDEYLKADYSHSLLRKPAAVLAAQTHLPETVDARLIGTATHLVIASLDLSKPADTNAVKKTIENLVAQDNITESLGGLLDAKSITAFFETDLGRAAIDSANKVFREWPFTFALPADELSKVRDTNPEIRDTRLVLSAGVYPEVPEGKDTRYEIRDTRYESRDTIIIQGVIDMLIETPEGLIVIDFKTDNVTEKEVPARAELYREQTDLYARAASAILKQDMVSKYVYFLSPACAFSV